MSVRQITRISLSTIHSLSLSRKTPSWKEIRSHNSPWLTKILVVPAFHTPSKEKYAIPYNGEEVYLHWANSDQYYVKTGEYFTDYRYKAPNGVTVHFRLQQADVPQNNVKGDKRFFLPLVEGARFDAEAKEVIVPFEFRPLHEAEQTKYGQRDQQDTILREAIETLPSALQDSDAALGALVASHHRTSDGAEVSFLAHHLRQYAQKNTSDFFIHKDLKGFLTRELDFYLKNEVLNLDEMEAAGEIRAEGWFQMMRVIRGVGSRIIDFLAQIEDFQKKLFEKKKFITETQYCITLGSVAEEFYAEIATCEAQWTEWKELFHIDEEEKNLFNNGAQSRADRRVTFLKGHPTLVLDTRHFDPAFRDRVLAGFEDLDEITDGLLIHSENFQALNLLVNKYRERIKCIYIDPPYNTGEDEFLYKDEYQHSSWLAMIADRLAVANSVMRLDGLMLASIDDTEVANLWALLRHRLPSNRYLGTFVWKRRSASAMSGIPLSLDHEYVLAWARDPSQTDAGRVVENRGRLSVSRRMRPICQHRPHHRHDKRAETQSVLRDPQSQVRRRVPGQSGASLAFRPRDDGEDDC